MKIAKPFIVGGLFVALAAPAAAFTLPVMIPDICAFGHCIQFTHTTALAQIQGLYQKATQLANEARNLKNIGTITHQAVDRELAQLLGTSVSRGDVAAGAVVGQSAAAAQAIAGIDAKATGADGAQQQAQVGNLYLSSIASEAVKANALAAQKTLQEKTEDEQKRAATADLFGGKAPVGDDF